MGSWMEVMSLTSTWSKVRFGKRDLLAVLSQVTGKSAREFLRSPTRVKDGM